MWTFNKGNLIFILTLSVIKHKNTGFKNILSDYFNTPYRCYLVACNLFNSLGWGKCFNKRNTKQGGPLKNKAKS